MWAPLTDEFNFNLTGKLANYSMYEMRMHVPTMKISTTLIDWKYNVEFTRLRDDCYGLPCRYGFAGWIEESLQTDGAFKVGFLQLVHALRKYKHRWFDEDEHVCICVGICEI